MPLRYALMMLSSCFLSDYVENWTKNRCPFSNKKCIILIVLFNTLPWEQTKQFIFIYMYDIFPFNENYSYSLLFMIEFPNNPWNIIETRKIISKYKSVWAWSMSKIFIYLLKIFNTNFYFRLQKITCLFWWRYVVTYRQTN